MTTRMTKLYTLFLTVLFIFSNTPANAQDKLFGLAMHGQTKYNTQSPNLDYANPNAPKGGILKQSAIGTFDTLNPFSLKGQAPLNMNLINDRLMRRVWDEPFTLYPLIAEHVEIPNDRSSIKIHINPTARFHDGAPITTQDVMFSYETLRDHGRPNMRKIYKIIKETKIIDNHTIKFTLGEGFDHETVMIIAMMPVLSKKYWKKRDFDSALTESPLGNGPYKVKEFDLGRKIIYERVHDYWAKDLFVNKGHYNFEEVSFDYYRDDTIALEALKKGDLNLRREWNISKWQTQYKDIPRSLIKAELKHQRPERAEGLIFNLRRPLFKDKNIRKALSLAFHHEWVAKNLYNENFKRITGVFPNSILSAPFKIQHDQPNFRQRLRDASNLLKKSGWNIVDRKRVNTNTGQQLKFELIVSKPRDEKIALTYQRALERLGIEMDIRVLDAATFQNRKTTYDYDMLSFHWQNSLSPGTEQRLYWSCDAAKEQARFNYSGICTPELDSLTDKIANAATYDDLTKSAHAIDQIIQDQNTFIPLFYKDSDYIAHHQNITSTGQTPIYGAVLETWWMKKNP